MFRPAFGLFSRRKISTKPKRNWRRVRLEVEQLEDRSLPSVSSTVYSGLGLNFDANNNPVTPPDCNVAAGPTWVIEVVNNEIQFINKATLTNNPSTSIEDFTTFFPVATFQHGFFGFPDIITNPQANYDEASGQFVVSMLDISTVLTDKGYLDVAILAKGADPTNDANWNKFQIDLTTGHGPMIPGNGNGPLWGDSDVFGSNDQAYVWTVNMFTFANNPTTGLFDSTYCLFDHVQVIAMQKDGTGVNQVDLPGWDSINSKVINENLIPVKMHGAEPMLFAEETNYADTGGQNNSLTLLQAANILTATTPSDFVASTVTVPTYNYLLVPDPSGAGNAWNRGDKNSEAQQNDGTTDLLQTGDTRIRSATWRTVGSQQHLVLTQTVNDAFGVAKAVWYDIDPSTDTVLNTGVIHAGDSVSTYFPSADIAPNGDIGMTYLESSATEFLSMYITGKQPGDSSMEPAVLVSPGDSPLTGPDPAPHRTGDYSGTTLDMTASGSPTNSFWSANEYTSTSTWATALTSYSVSPPIGPAVMISAPTVAGDGTVSSLVFTFNEGMDTTSIPDSSDVDPLLTSGSIASLTFKWNDSTHLEADFTPLPAGNYTLTIGHGTHIRAAGTLALMDQDQDGPDSPPAEATDQFTASFTVGAQNLIEDFDQPETYHLVFGAATFSLTAAASQTGVAGDLGLDNQPGSDWIYRDDVNAQVHQGNTISAWVKFSGGTNAVAVFGFGANTISPDGTEMATYSFVLNANTNQIHFQESDVHSSSELDSTLNKTPYPTLFTGNTFQQDHWYKITVIWNSGLAMTGQVFDTNGTTLLGQVHPDITPALFTSGGIAFHAVAAKNGPANHVYWDTITDPPTANVQLTGVVSTSTSQGTTASASLLNAALVQVMNSLMPVSLPATIRTLDAAFSAGFEPTRQSVMESISRTVQGLSYGEAWNQQSHSGGIGSADSDDADELGLLERLQGND
jgi:hypothetical protein